MDIPEHLFNEWQEITNILADLADVPVALIMHCHDQKIEVFVTSKSEENPYKKGSKEELYGSGLYCERVIKTKDKLLVPNALKDKEWEKNPDLKLQMISYLGFPIYMPDNQPFGTICILDRKENAYSPKIESLMKKFQSLIESHLSLYFMNQVLGDKNKELKDYIQELRLLRGIVPICMYCKSIKDEDEKWQPIEKYILNLPDADFSHGICPDCLEERFPE